MPLKQKKIDIIAKHGHIKVYIKWYIYNKNENGRTILIIVCPNLPLSEASSTNKISARSSGGDRFTTECTVRKRVERASLWNITIIEADGSWLGYCLFKHL